MTRTILSDSRHQSIVEQLGDLTLRKTAAIGLEHARLNRPFADRGIDDLSGRAAGRRAIVVAAGPSLHRRQTIRRIRDAAFNGVVIATDGALSHCLREGVVPDYVVSVDPHPTRIVRWFGDPELSTRERDTYFSRQDLDPEFLQNEATVNARTVALVDSHAGRITAVLSTSVAPTVTARVRASGMPIYWWNPVYDDYDQPGSVTAQVQEIVPVPSMIAGGNCGTAAWVFAGAILEAPIVAVVGMDLGYAPDTPLTHTQYFPELRELFGDDYQRAYIAVDNPHLERGWFTDPTYWWYRETLLELAELAPFKTVNCTEGGILFGPSVAWRSLDDFLNGKDSLR